MVRDVEVLRFADSVTVLAAPDRDLGIVNHFSAMRYLASNPGLIGVFGANADAAIEHYVRYGFDERRPINSFDGYRYLAGDIGLLSFFGPDATAATDHYVRYGYSEGRSTTAFDPDLYLASNPGLIPTP